MTNGGGQVLSGEEFHIAWLALEKIPWHALKEREREREEPACFQWRPKS